MTYRVFIEDFLEFCTIAQLLYFRNRSELVSCQDFDKFVKTFKSLKDAKAYIKEFFSDIDEEVYKECWVAFVVVIKDDEVINIQEYNHDAKLVEELF